MKKMRKQIFYLIVSSLVAGLVFLLQNLTKYKGNSVSLSGSFRFSLVSKLSQPIHLPIPQDLSSFTLEKFSRSLSSRGYEHLFLISDIKTLEKLVNRKITPIVYLSSFSAGRGHIFVSLRPFLLKGIDNRKGVVTLSDASLPKSFSITRDWFQYLWDREGNICLTFFSHKLKKQILNDIQDEKLQRFKKISEVLDRKSRGINLTPLKPALKELVEKFPEWNYPAYVLIRDVLIPEGEINEAKEAVKNLLAKKPDNPYHRLLETLIYLEEGNYEQAVNSATVFEREIRKRKFPDLESVYILSFLYTKAGLFQRAEEIINWALKISPQKKDLLILRAFYHFERGRMQEAIKDVRSAISLPPKDSFPLWDTLLLEAYSTEDNLKKCEEIAKRVGKSAHNSKINLWVELLKAEKSGKWDEALSIWDRIYEGSEEEKHYSNYFVGKASILLKMGKFKEARRFLEEQPLLEAALREKRNNLGFLGMFSIYGITLYKCGEFEKAVDVLFRAYKCVEMDKGLRWFLGPYEVKTLASTEYYLGLALRKEGKEIEANKFIEKAKSWGFSLPQ